MNKLLYYKGYSGSIEFSEEDQLFYGKVLGIRSLISYEGKTIQQLLTDFHKAIFRNFRNRKKPEIDLIPGFEFLSYFFQQNDYIAMERMHRQDIRILCKNCCRYITRFQIKHRFFVSL